MPRRLRQLFTLLSFSLLLGLLALWTGDHAVILRTVHQADARSHLFIRRGSLQIDYTGLYYSLRDVRRAGQVAVACDRVERLPTPLLMASGDAGPWSFHWQSTFVRRTPLQDLTDPAGQPIVVEQSVPLKLLTVPAWLVALLLAIAPIRSVCGRIRCGRAAWVSPLRWPMRHPVAIFTASTVAIAVVWLLGIIRPATYYQNAPNDVRRVVLCAGGGLTIADRVPAYYDWQQDYLGTAGIAFQRMDAIDWQLIAPAGSTVTGTSVYRHTPLWMLFLLSAFVPLAALAMRFWGRRQLEGHCPNCDYDLRFSVERCPECGRSISATPPRVGRCRAQGTRFALAAILLMLAGVLATAWAQDADLFVSGDASNRATWVTVNDGRLSAHRGRRIRSSLVVSTRVMSMPAWIPTAGLFLASAGMFWAALAVRRVHGPLAHAGSLD